MNLIIFAGNLATSAELRQIIIEKMNAAFARIDTRLSCIRISVRDMNGNRPGLEKRCQIIISRPGSADLVINSSAGKTRKAVAQAISRAAHALTRKPRTKARPARTTDYFMKRIALFLITNLAVVLTLSVVAHLLGLNAFVSSQGLDFTGLLGFAALFGFGGALISLAISKWSAKMAVGARVIENPANADERWLVETVTRQAKTAKIGVPEIAIYDSPEVNAFATGMNRNNALVAVSTGLLQRMTRDEAEAVLGHEVAHVANGDMVTLALIQGVLNTFVIVISRAVGWLIDRVVFKNEDGPGIGYYVTFFVLEILLGILASVVVMWFSRRREFRADLGGAQVAGRVNMIAALERLKSLQEESQLPARVAAFGVAGNRRGGLMSLFATHPALEDRIQALRTAAP